VATTEQYLPIRTAGRQFGVPYRTLRNRVVDRTLPTYASDRDRRVTLVAVADMRRLFEPRPNTQEVDALSTA